MTVSAQNIFLGHKVSVSLMAAADHQSLWKLELRTLDILSKK